MPEKTPSTICDALDYRAQLTPNQPLMFFRERSWSCQEVQDQVQRLAHGFQEAGLTPGERLLGVFDKSPEAVLCFLATVYAGGVFVPLNPQLGDPEVEIVFKETNPVILVASPQYIDRFRHFSATVFPDRKSCRVYSSDVNVPDGLGQILAKQSAVPTSCQLEPDDIVYLNYTSGTTGIPKGAITTHRHILENTRSVAQALKLQPDDVHLCMFPIHNHPHEIFARALLIGGSFVLVDSIHPRTIAEAITRHRITCMMGVTPMYRSLLTVANSPEYDFSSLRTPESGGMDSPVSFVEEFEQTFGRRFLPVWGSTETSGVAIATPPMGETISGSLGRACPGYKVKLVNENGKEVIGPGEGEMWVRGAAVVSEYWKRPEDTKTAFQDGWYRTGDIARREDGDFYSFQGRLYGMMKVGGMKVFPVEIERVLTEHPGVEEAVVISIKDRMKGEIPKAFVIPKSGRCLSRTELRKHCQERLPLYKMPRRFEFRDSLPRTPGGKVLRSILESSETTAEPIEPVSDVQEELVRIDRRILSLLNRRSQLLGQETEPKTPMLIPEEYLQRVLDSNQGPLYDDVAEDLLKQIHSATTKHDLRFPRGK